MTKRRMAVLIVTVIAAAVLGQLFLPEIVERRIESELKRSLGEVKLVRADVKAYPAYALLAGRLTSLNLDIRRVALGDLMVDAVLLDGRNLAVDMIKLISGRGVEVTSADSLRATFVIAEEDLNHYFWDKVHTSKFFRVALDRGRAILEGHLNLLGKELDVRVSGVFEITDGTTVSFVPKDVTVANTVVPRVLLEMITNEWGIALNLNQDAMPLVIEDLLVEDGHLLIYGTRPLSG